SPSTTTSTSSRVTLAPIATPKQIQFSTLPLPIPLSPTIPLSALSLSSPTVDLHLKSAFTRLIKGTTPSPLAILSPNRSHSALLLPESHPDAATTTKASSPVRRGFSD
ncbi:hypothetical protein LINPERPRIM_LOCUS36880, partial [Linum perenne]